MVLSMNSEALGIAERCLSAFPAGSNGEFNFPRSQTLVLAKGKGPMVWDTNGKEYLDFSMGWGSALVGHANLAVVEAATTQAAYGANFACVNERSLELAERLIKISPACDQVRFCASGTEATMYCARIARACTGREKILKFEGAYHGANDLGVTSLFPSELKPFPNSEKSCHGVSDSSADQIMVAPFNDLNITGKVLAEHADEIAAVIVEPLHRCLKPAPGFLRGLRELCDIHNVLLIFDEVVTGFRLAFGGAQEYYGVVPDLVAYGKGLGGGFPIGVFGGRQELMCVTQESRMNEQVYVWTASTLGGNPVTCAAAMATLDHLSASGTYQQLFDTGAYLRSGLRSVLESHDVPHQVLGDGPLAQFVFSETPITDYRSTNASDKALARRVMLGLVDRGIFLNPMGTKLYISTEHSITHCDEMLNRFADTLAEHI